MRRFSVVAAIVALVACGPDPAPANPGDPVQTEAPNARGQEPAFSNQTRAPQPQAVAAVTQRVVVEGLERPWAVEALADGRLLVTERPGRLRVVTADGRLLEPVSGVPEVFAQRQGGLLDVIAQPQSDGSLFLCLSYAEPREGGVNNTAVACGSATGREQLTLAGLRVVFRQAPSFDSGLHFGSRIAFAPDGETMFITTGERSKASIRPLAQDVATTIGKVVRINRDGSAPSDNPFVAGQGEARFVWSLGHRNIQSAAIDPASGALWTVEHGPRGGDELNKPEAGKNYGWPIITYGIDYSGQPIGEGVTAQAGMEQPVYYWDPVIAPSGMVFYSGDRFADWRGDALIGGLIAKSLVRLTLENDRVVSEEWIPIGARVRDVAQGADGAVYVVTDDENGRLIALTPGP